MTGIELNNLLRHKLARAAKAEIAEVRCWPRQRSPISTNYGSTGIAQNDGENFCFYSIDTSAGLIRRGLYPERVTLTSRGHPEKMLSMACRPSRMSILASCQVSPEYRSGEDTGRTIHQE